MTCKNCIHLPVCVLRIHWGYGSDWNNRYTPDVEKRCKSFKNAEDMVEVKHGEWIWKGTILREISTVCSECGAINHPYNYCPNCGAKMKKEGAENG